MTVRTHAKPNRSASVTSTNRPTDYKVNSDKTAAVSTDAEFLPMSTCPRGVKVILLGAGGVATIGQYDGKEPFWKGWHPMLRKPKDMK